MRVIEKTDVYKLVPAARNVLAMAGRKVLEVADDESITGLAAAHVNRMQLRSSGVGDVSACWCLGMQQVG